MRVIRGLSNLRPEERGAVITIGNFDGVHRGHQSVLKMVCEHGQAMHRPALAITFEPQPLEYFNPSAAPARLTCLREKIMALQQSGLDGVVLLQFNQALASIAPERFITEILVAQLAIQRLLIGDDFRFGRQRQGDYELLQTMGKRYGFATEKIHSLQQGQQRISSTRIREALAQGDISFATQLLGRPYCFSGRVGYGAQRGRTIGFPTANILLKRRISPLTGVYIVWVHGAAANPWPGIANIGYQPTVSGTEQRLEVHLLNFTGQLYGCHLTVEMIAKVRDEQKFSSLMALRAQIDHDSKQAWRFFRTVYPETRI
jgi:riboflavin kinase/FMN adenylyltransferase